MVLQGSFELQYAWSFGFSPPFHRIDTLMRDPTKSPLYIHHPFDPNRWRYYVVGHDTRFNTGDMKLLNEDEVIRDQDWGGHIKIRPERVVGPERIRHFDGGWYGLPNLYAKPRIKVGIRGALHDVYWGTKYYVSSRAKRLLESIDPEAFEFAECDTTTRGKREIEPYWMFAVKRVVLEYDQERSILIGRNKEGCHETIYRDIGFGALKFYDFIPDIKMPTMFHAFNLALLANDFIFDQTIVDRWREEKLTGWFFTPLQPPSPREAKYFLSFKNKEYYLRCAVTPYELIGEERPDV